MSCKMCNSKIVIGQSSIGKKIKDAGYCSMFCIRQTLDFLEFIKGEKKE